MGKPGEELNRIAIRQRYLFILKGEPSEEETLAIGRKLMEYGQKMKMPARAVDVMEGALMMECSPAFVREAEKAFPDLLYKISPQPAPKPQPAGRPGASPKKPPAKPKPPGPRIF